MITRPGRPAIIHIALGALAALVLVKSAYLQLWEGGELAERAQRQYFRIDTIPAPRGEIVDETGRSLAQSTEKLSLAIAPREVRDADRAALRTTLAKIGLSRQWQNRALDTVQKQRWIEIPGRYMPEDLGGIRLMKGVYAEPVVQRASYASAGARAVLGRVAGSGAAEGGLERILDGQLRGTPGLVRLTRDHASRRDREVLKGMVQEPIPGNRVTLTLNSTLQGIAERALEDAVTDRGARGGDIVIVEPATGAVRAIASYSRELGFTTMSAISQSFEPGSSVKPLLVSRLLELKRAAPDDVMETGETLAIPGRRTPIRDDHPEDSFTLSDVVKFSSNIGMVKFSDRLTIDEQFEAYRDFGFGMPTGISLPGEDAGRIDAPLRWTPVTKSATAIGYGMMVSTLQLAMAFAAIANGGELMEPLLVKEIHAPNGDLLLRQERRVVRRVMSANVSAQVRTMLRGVVEGGTAPSADIQLGEVGGKTGTARLSAGRQGYLPGQYTATFAGMFPLHAPQFVIVVRLVNPRGAYGGTTAAPVVAAVLKAAAVAQNAAMDMGALARLAAATSMVGEESDNEGDGILELRRVDGRVVADPAAASENGFHIVSDRESAPRLISLVQLAGETEHEAVPRSVPRVAGMPVRAAVHALHSAGFRVKVTGSGDAAGGTVRGTTPDAGAMRKPGELIALHSGL